MRWRIPLVFVAAFAAVLEGVCQREAPPLPPGLGPARGEDEGTAPPLPPGLEPRREGPALPPGLGGEIQEESEKAVADRRGLPFDLHGFWEARGGIRLRNDHAQPRDFVVGETRLQLETVKTWDRVSVEGTVDGVLDGVLEKGESDVRRLRMTAPIGDNVDVSVGRQVSTWGTGDLIFINDLFPKDWQSFLSGRDEEYLKAPADVLRVSWYGDWMNVDVVYTPRFQPDRFITGERISFWSPLKRRRAGRDDQVKFRAPNGWFRDDEIAVRLHRTFGSAEVAAYGYRGYWKSPAGQRLVPIRAIFPRLSVYGASIRGPLGKGIANAEFGYYDSRDDRRARKPLVDNSEIRFLVGYEQEIGREFTGAVQYYLVHMLDHGSYRRTLPFFIDARDKNRHVVSLRLTKLLMNQDLTLSSFLFYSPSDGDGYWRPRAVYTVNDHWRVEAGGNVFFGKSGHTFYAQFQDNTNIYAAARYSF